LIKNAFTVDLEDWYQGIEMPYETWGNYEQRVEVGMNRLLQLLSDSDTKATFFTLGWIAETYPDMIKLLAAEGHELASHGYSHEKVYDLKPKKFREEIRRTKSVIEDLSGTEVSAFRAPFFSVTVDSLWALPILREEGHTVDCSIASVKTWRYGIRSSIDDIYLLSDIDMIEFPVSTFNLLHKSAALGGAYFRLFPFYLSWRAYKKRIAKDRHSMFYIHPWEYDPDHPHEEKMEKKARFTHYTNLKKTSGYTEKILKKMNFTTVSDVISKTVDKKHLPQMKVSDLHDD